MPTSDYTAAYLNEVRELAARLDPQVIDRMIGLLLDIHSHGGRVFFLGVGGGAGHAGHAVNDFRKIAGIECYAPTDNVSELTARINDDGWDSCFSDVVEAALCAAKNATTPFSVFNVATDDAVTVTEIADLAVQTLGLPAKPVFEYTGGRRGWRGDVPVVRLDSSRIRSFGWFPKRNSHDAVRQSLQELIADERTLCN